MNINALFSNSLFIIRHHVNVHFLPCVFYSSRIEVVCLSLFEKNRVQYINSLPRMYPRTACFAPWNTLAHKLSIKPIEKTTNSYEAHSWCTKIIKHTRTHAKSNTYLPLQLFTKQTPHKHTHTPLSHSEFCKATLSWISNF